MDYRIKNTQKDIRQQYENKCKEAYLRHLSIKDSLEIFNNLYRLSLQMGKKPFSKDPAITKINSLIKIHSMFGNVKP